MWRHLVFLTTLTLGALALSVLLVPRGQELALMYYKAQRYGEALSGFEQAFYADRGPVTTIVPLTRLYLRQGDVARAVAAMDRTLESRPRDIEALDLALELYRDTMRPERYLHALERRVELAPSAQLVRELAGLYAFAGDDAGEIRALLELLDTDNASAAEMLRLARLYWVRGDSVEAEAVLDRWAASARVALDRNTALFALDVYARAGRADAIARTVAHWAGGVLDPNGFMQAIAVIARKGLEASAVPVLRDLLERHPGHVELVAPAFALSRIARDPALFTAYAASIDRAQALRGIRHGGVPTAPLAPSAVALVLELREEIARAGADVGALIAALAAAGHAQLSGLLAPALGTAGLPVDDLTAAEYLLLAGRVSAAAARLEAYRRPPGDPALRLREANAWFAVGRDGAARALLDELPEWPAPLHAALAWLHYDLGAGAVAWTRFGAALAAARGPAAGEAWAVLAAAGGEHAALERWLAAGAGAPPVGAEALFELTLLALERGDPDHLQRLARRVGTPGKAAGIDGARSLLETGRYAEAAVASAPRVASDAGSRALFQEALFSLWRMRALTRGGMAGLQAGVAYLIDATLAAGAPDDVQTRTLVYDLLAAGAYAPASDLLDALVRRAPALWYDAYRDAAVGAQRHQALFEFIVTHLASGGAAALEETMLYDLERLGGGARLLPLLVVRVADAQVSSAAREAAYYRLREVAVGLGREAWLCTRLEQWLATTPPDAPLARTWRHELGVLGGAARALPYMVQAAHAARGQAARSAAFYALQSAAQAAARPEIELAFLGARLRAGEPDPVLAEIYREALLAHPQRAAAAPLLAELAARDAQQWAAAYVGWLAAGGEIAALRELARAHRDGPGLTAAARRTLADHLLSAGFKREALGLYRALAAAEPPGGEHVGMLLWLWGPRPEAAALDWLAARAHASTGRERAAWAELLAARGAPARAAAVLAAPAALAGADPVVVERHVDALLAAGDADAAAAAIARVLERGPSRAMARWAARSAIAARRPALAERAWRAVLARAAHDPGALRALALAAYEDGRRGAAERWLERYLARVEDDYEARFLYAEALLERGAASRAIPHYRHLLEYFEAVGADDFRARVVRAQALHRLGHEQAALGAFERLLAERPTAGDVRADYVTMLLDNRRLGRARQLLSERAPQ